METVLTLRDLRAWADAHGLSKTLDAPIGEIFADLQAVVPSKPVLDHLVRGHACGTLRAMLEHPAADKCLRLRVSRSVSPAFVSTIQSWLTKRDRAHVLIPAPPVEVAALRYWAAEHDVVDRLNDPATVLLSRLPGQLQALVKPNGHTPRVVDFVSGNAHGQGRRSAQMGFWQQDMLTQVARSYLHDVARVRADVQAARDALELRARDPSEPSLRALAQRVEAARDEIGKVVSRRPIGTYVPRPLEIAGEPLRFVYLESIEAHRGAPLARVNIAVEEDPLQPQCSCASDLPGAVSRCEHALAALDSVADLLRDPQRHRAHERLASHLATPPWMRFLNAFGDGIARATPSVAPTNERLCFRIQRRAGASAIETLVQKPLKRGGWSVGQRISPSELARRPALTRDPQDARVVDILCEGLEDTGFAYAYTAPSRARVFRALTALVGHPHAFLADRPGTPVHIETAPLRLILEPCDGGIAAVLALGDHRYRPVELRAAAERTSQVIVIDDATATVLLCTIDARAEALMSALERFPARFPPESHDDLLRALSPLQESVAIELPEVLQGAPIDADRRPVVRISPAEAGPETEVAILVRAIPGGPLFRPGEGPAVVLHSMGGRRVAAHRALAEEPIAAMAVVRSLPLPQTDAPNPDWTYQLPDQESVLDLLAALRTLGDAVVVEWPDEGRRIDVAGTALRRSLKLRITDKRDWFGVDGEVMVDDEAVSFSALLEAVRSGRRFVEVGRHRFAVIEDELRQRLAAAADLVFKGRGGLEVALPAAGALADLVDDPGQLEAVVRWRKLVQRIDAARGLEPAVPEGVRAELRPYQTEGFRWLARLAAWGMGGCLADDMGLGKTVQALALLVERAPRGPALVLAPTSVGPNWVAETARFAPGLRVQLYRGAGRGVMLAGLGAGDLLVTSYGLATRDAEALAGVRFATLVIDEAQAIKNALTRRARAVRDLDAEFCLALSGTPVENHLGELWSLMRVVAPGLFGSWDQFRERFAAPIERARDPERRAALARTVRPFLLRRTKAEVAPELPERTEIARFVDLSPAERRLYDEARRAALTAIASGEHDARFILLAALTRLRRLACHPRLGDDASTVPSSKLAALLEIVRELRETGHRALVFSQFTSHLALVREALDTEGITYAYLDGSTPSEERTRRIATFQAGGPDLFLISLKAGGTGLNLTAADYVIHLDPWWNPAVEDQATDRAHRIGQNKAVTVIRLIVRGTIEEAVLALHGDKRALAAGVFDGEGGPARLSAEDLAELIRTGASSAGGESSDEDTDDTMGGELIADDTDTPESRPSRPALTPSRPVRAEKAPVAASPLAPDAPPAAAPLSAFADRVLDHLAARRHVADRRYDNTLRAYERSLRRFIAYVAAQSEERALRAAPGSVIDGYLDALRAGRWQAPASEPKMAAVVMNHVRAFLAEQPLS